MDPSLKKIDGVIFKGPLFDVNSKRQVFLNSDLMILPSKSENFGYVILESIRAGLPVLTTTQTPWENIKQTNSGWIIEQKQTDLEKVLKKLMKLMKRFFS